MTVSGSEGRRTESLAVAADAARRTSVRRGRYDVAVNPVRSVPSH